MLGLKLDFNHARFIRSALADSPLVNAYLAYIPFGYIFQIRSLREILPGEEICLAAGYGPYINQFHCFEEDIAVDTGESSHNIVTELLEDEASISLKKSLSMYLLVTAVLRELVLIIYMYSLISSVIIFDFKC